jgi:hypothetical protein
VQELIASDAVVAELHALLEHLDEQVAADDLTEAARRLSSQLVSDFLADKRSSGPARGVRVFDSALLPVPDGVRPASVDTRQLRFRVSDWEVVFALYPVTSDSYEVMGRISGLGDDTAVEVVLSAGKQTERAETDKLHLFRFARVSTGTYRVVFSDKSGEIGTLTLEI